MDHEGCPFTPSACHGDIDIPVIDWRHYLEDRLDMHNAHQSFASRQRMRDADGDAGNQVIWFTDARPNGPQFDQTPEALRVMDTWMANIRAHPGRMEALDRRARPAQGDLPDGSVRLQVILRAGAHT